jgi:hypothetical protein
MLLVKTRIGQSNIHGVGLFADQFIQKGTPIWRYTEGFDLSIPPSKVRKLALPAREQFLKYSYISQKTGKYVLCFDDSRFFNHSDTPNVIGMYTPGEEDMDVAAQDIQEGEELTCDYRSFEVGFDERMYNHNNNHNHSHSHG